MNLTDRSHQFEEQSTVNRTGRVRAFSIHVGFRFSVNFVAPSKFCGKYTSVAENPTAPTKSLCNISLSLVLFMSFNPKTRLECSEAES